jgi:hypothetical protein
VTIVELVTFSVGSIKLPVAVGTNAGMHTEATAPYRAATTAVESTAT